jgi:6-phosphogluconate dehydrogenase
MQLGMIGLGRMGANIVRRLIDGGHECVVYARRPESRQPLEQVGAIGAASLDEFVAKLSKPRVAWVMVPAAATGEVVHDLASRMEPGDIIIDGGNSYYRDDVDRAAELESKRIHYVDVGTSGGVFGLERGFCLMIGGEPAPVEHLDPLFKTIAPGIGSESRTPGSSGAPSPAEHGYLHCGPVGAGHFVKMVHNGIEYGIMASYAEGFNVLRHANVGKRDGGAEDAETAPLRDPRYYRYDLDLPQIAEVWRRGSVVASWLLDLTAAALAKSPDLKEFSGRVSDSGEGRWTIHAAVDTGVPASVLSDALYERLSSRGEAGFADQLLSALRSEFGGHAEKPAD